MTYSFSYGVPILQNNMGMLVQKQNIWKSCYVFGLDLKLNAHFVTNGWSIQIYKCFSYTLLIYIILTAWSSDIRWCNGRMGPERSRTTYILKSEIEVHSLENKMLTTDFKLFSWPFTCCNSFKIILCVYSMLASFN